MLLILSLERIGVVYPPEFLYREYDSKCTLRCDLMIFVARSTRYPDVDPRPDDLEEKKKT